MRTSCGPMVLLLFLALTMPVIAAVDEKPTRTVNGQTLTSTELPAVTLEFGKEFKYVGGHAFILYGVARAEQHFFVDADDKGNIRRMYWIQFEGYLPDNQHSYRYRKTKSANIGGLEFVADSGPVNVNANPGRPDSDGNHARRFLKGKGYQLASGEVMNQRLVHLPDEAKRNELMIIYSEDLAPHKLTAKELAPGGAARTRWDEIAKGLLDRAVKQIKLTPVVK